MPEANDAIGIFDSGVGGLTVFRQVAERLPRESIVYLGDTARVPYGTKSPETVVRYARACAAVLQARGIKLLVVACNTASAFGVEVLRAELDIPVIDVIGPGARAALDRTRSGQIGVIGTTGTVASQAYPHTIAALRPETQVHALACPLFVPLVEEGWTEGPVPEAIARQYLQALPPIDTLVLGCTHYPLLARTLQAVLGPDVVLVDSAEETARAVVETMDALDLACTQPMTPRHRFLVSDGPEGFQRIGARFLGHALADIEWVDF
jgi:glutamate racemase